MENEYFISNSGCIYAKVVNNQKFIQVSVRTTYSSITVGENEMTTEDYHNPVLFQSCTQQRFETAFNEAAARISAAQNITSFITN